MNLGDYLCPIVSAVLIASIYAIVQLLGGNDWSTRAVVCNHLARDGVDFRGFFWHLLPQNRASSKHQFTLENLRLMEEHYVYSAYHLCRIRGPPSAIGKHCFSVGF